MAPMPPPPPVTSAVFPATEKRPAGPAPIDAGAEAGAEDGSDMAFLSADAGPVRSLARTPKRRTRACPVPPGFGRTLRGPGADSPTWTGGGLPGRSVEWVACAGTDPAGV